MRQTTKIILGITGGIVALSLLFIIGFSFTDRKYYSDYREYRKEISQENPVEIKIENFKTVCLNFDSSPLEKSIYMNGILSIRPLSKEDSKQKLVIPEELAEYIKTSVTNDTLFILFDPNKPIEVKNAPIHSRILDGVNIYLNTQEVDIVNNLRIGVNVQGVKTDYIKIRSNITTIDSCEAVQVTPTGYGNLKITNCSIHDLNIDLDEIGNWNVENSDILAENLSGENTYRLKISKDKIRALNWYPKNKDAKLHLEIGGEDQAQLTFE